MFITKWVPSVACFGYGVLPGYEYLELGIMKRSMLKGYELVWWSNHIGSMYLEK